MGLAKCFLVFLFLFFLVLPSYAFIHTYNEKGLESQYFSFESPIVKVVSNESLVVVSYWLSNGTYNRTFNLSSCEGGFCGAISLLDFVNISKDTFLGSIKFVFSDGTETKTVYLDLVNPVLNVSYSLNKSRLIVNVSCQDSLSGVADVTSQIVRNNSVVFATNKTNFSVVLGEGGYEMVEKCYDKAGNLNVVEKRFFVKDFLPPSVVVTGISDLGKILQINFTLRDSSNISSYQVVTSSYLISGTKQGDVINESILIPIVSSFYIKASDSFNNSIVYKVNVTFPSLVIPKVSNVRVVKVSGDFDSCELLKVDNESVRVNFTDLLRVPLDRVGNHSLYFSCRKGPVVKDFRTYFYYDNVSPTLPLLWANATKEGILVRWGVSRDRLPVSYVLYRDGKVIYRGRENSYLDRKVSYPKVYSYFLKVKDLAGNFVVSKSLNISPLDLKAELRLSQRVFNVSCLSKSVVLRVYGEKGSNLYVYRIVNGSRLEVEEMLVNSSVLVVKLQCSVGATVYEIREVDPHGNKVSKFVTINSKSCGKKSDVIAKSAENIQESGTHIRENVRKLRMNGSASNVTNSPLSSAIGAILVGKDNVKWLFVGLILIVVLLVLYNLKRFKRTLKSGRKRGVQEDLVKGILERRKRHKDSKRVEKRKNVGKEIDSNAKAGRKDRRESSKSDITEYEKRKRKDLADKRRPMLDMDFLVKSKVDSKANERRKGFFHKEEKGPEKEEGKGDDKNESSLEKKQEVDARVGLRSKSKDVLFGEGYFDRHRRGWNSRSYVAKKDKKEVGTKEDEVEKDREKGESTKPEEREALVKRSLEDYLVRKRSRFKELIFEKKVDEDTKDL